MRIKERRGGRRKEKEEFERRTAGRMRNGRRVSLETKQNTNIKENENSKRRQRDVREREKREKRKQHRESKG